MKQKGWVVTFLEPIKWLTKLLDPANPEQVMDNATGDDLRVNIQAAFLPSLESIRRTRPDQITKVAKLYPQHVKLLKEEDVVRWGLRQMHEVEVVGDEDDLTVISVEGIKEPQLARAIPFYEDLRLKPRLYPFERIALERINELAKKTDFGDDTRPKPPQMSEIREKGILLLRILSYFAPLAKGNLAMASGKPKLGKTTILLMIFYLYRWILLDEEKNSRLIYLNVGEREGELGEIQMLSHHPQMEFFGNSKGDGSEKGLLAGELAVARTMRHIEMGRDVVVFVDSFSRLSTAISEATSGSKGSVSGGHALEALTEPRKDTGISGVYSLSPDGATCSCTVIGTILRGDYSFRRVFSDQMDGTTTADWPLTDQGKEYPMLDVASKNAVSTRKIPWLNISPLERWFIKELRQRVNDAGFRNGKRAEPWECIKLLKRIFQDKGPKQVMAEWWREEIKSQIQREFGTKPTTNNILVDKWDLKLDQAKILLDAENGFSEDDVVVLDSINISKEQIQQFVAGNLAKEELEATLQEWKNSWSNPAYTDALLRSGEEKPNTLSSQTCAPLREAGINAADFFNLLREGYEVREIKTAAMKGATAENIRKRLATVKNGDNGRSRNAAS